MLCYLRRHPFPYRSRGIVPSQQQPTDGLRLWHLDIGEAATSTGQVKQYYEPIEGLLHSDYIYYSLQCL